MAPRHWGRCYRSPALYRSCSSRSLIRSAAAMSKALRSEEHTSELQSHSDLHSFPTRRSSDLNGTSTLGPLLQVSRTIPIVFVQVTDPVGSGYVESLAKPGGNATGFSTSEYGVRGKWLEVLKQIAPSVTRAGVIRNPAVPSGSGQFGAIQAVAPYLRMEVTPIDVRDPAEMDRTVAAFAGSPNGGLIITASGAAVVHRSLIIALAARLKLPTVFWQRHFVEAGGLVSYGDDGTDQYRRAAEYVDRILKGEKPSDLPVQAPTKYATVINLKTAKALGLEIPSTILARADEVIE